MEIILLDDVRNLGQFGTQVKVKSGYGRNFLIPQGKAVPATKENLEKFAARRQDLEKEAKKRLQAAQERAAEIAAIHLTISARAGEEGKLYGSIGSMELVKALKDMNIDVKRQEVRLPNGPLRALGDFELELQLHAEVLAQLKVTIKADDKA